MGAARFSSPPSAAFGQGKGSLTTALQAFSFSRCGRPDLEDGDKIILPSVSNSCLHAPARPRWPGCCRPPHQSSIFPPLLWCIAVQELFRAVSRLRLPLPFLFKLSKGTKPASVVPTRTGKASPPFEQYCGVMEFSADKGKCFLPKWMMRNLKTREGGSIVLTSQRGVSSLTAHQQHAPLFVCPHNAMHCTIRALHSLAAWL